MKRITGYFLIALFLLATPAIYVAAQEGGITVQPKYVKAAAVDKSMNANKVISENYNNKELKVTVGETFKISLDSNPTTGYDWTLADWDKSLLALADKGFINPNSSPTLVGQAGKSYWTFKALKAGKQQLQMSYARPWESVQPLKKYQVTVVISAQKPAASTIKVTARKYNNKIENKSVTLNIPVISGLSSHTAESKINKLFEQEAMTWKAGVEADFNDYIKECQTAGYPIRPYELLSKYTVCTQNNRFLSLYVDYYQYTGGAHGGTDRRAYNIDLKTGQVITLKNLFNKNYDYKTLINQVINQEIAKKPDDYFTGDEGFKGINDKQRYYIKDKQLVVYFSQYEIAPYCAGFPEFKIPLSKFKGNYRTDLVG
jgi:predicted secreted protein